MTLITGEVFGEVTRDKTPRHYFDSIVPQKFAAASGGPTLAQLTPLYFDSATENWKTWTVDNEVQTLTFDATGGTYTLAFDGVVSPSLTYANDATDDDTILAALEALPGIGSGDVTVVRGTPVGNVTIFTVTFGGALTGTNVPAIAVTESLTGGNGTLVVATSTAGAGSADIDGFVAEPADGSHPCTLHATLETVHNVGMTGRLRYEDIPLPAGENQNMLDAALMGLRAKGYIIEGLPGFH